MSRSKTIQIFLKDSDMDGIKIADLSNSAARVYVIPREMIDFVRTRDDLSSPALYMLFDDERTTVYVGECESFQNRIIGHIANKDFWRWAVVCLTTGTGLDKAEVKFLESHAIQKAIEVNRFQVQNKTNPTKNNLHEFRLETVLDLFEDFELLVTTLGFNLFEPIRDKTPVAIMSAKLTHRSEKDTRDYDTLVAPATGDGRVEAFEKKSAWWAVRIGQSNIAKFKYIALYEGAPVSAIRSYATITRIEPYQDVPGKYIIYHDGNIIDLPCPIVIGDHPELSLFGPRYFKLEDLLKSKNMADLTDRAFGSDYQQLKKQETSEN